MPIVLKRFLSPGLRGLVIAGLLAAFMSTFGATVNAAASYIVRDLWQPLLGEKAEQKHLIRASYAATLGVVVAGSLIGLTVQSIGHIFSWIMMELGSAFVIPNVLRWYWWRLNGWGYAAGTLAGLAGAIALPVLPPLPLYVTFPAICVISLVGCIGGTLLTRPTSESVLLKFYRDVRPFGFWGPIRNVAALAGDDTSEGMSLAVVNVVLGATAILGLYLAPMYLVGHWHSLAAGWLLLAMAAAFGMYFTWYRRLPEAD